MRYLDASNLISFIGIQIEKPISNTFSLVGEVR